MKRWNLCHEPGDSSLCKQELTSTTSNLKGRCHRTRYELDNGSGEGQYVNTVCRIAWSSCGSNVTNPTYSIDPLHNHYCLYLATTRIWVEAMCRYLIIVSNLVLVLSPRCHSFNSSVWISPRRSIVQDWHWIYPRCSTINFPCWWCSRLAHNDVPSIDIVVCESESEHWSENECQSEIEWHSEIAKNDQRSCWLKWFGLNFYCSRVAKLCQLFASCQVGSRRAWLWKMIVSQCR